MFKKIILVVILVSCGFVWADDSSDLSKALQLLDLSKQELNSVKKLSDTGDTEKAFEEYKIILADRVASFESIETFSYWLYNSANADELLKGVLTTNQYGKPIKTTTKIGLPGSVQWYKVPEDGYATLLRDITTMHWVGKLAEKYEQTGDLRYLKAWQGYWDDFATNWPGEYEKAKRNPELMNLVEKRSILWSDIALYIGWRLEGFTQGFNAVCHRALRDGELDEIDNAMLARLLIHLDSFEAAKGIKWIERDGGVPNQRVHCATTMFELGVYLSDFKNSPRWRELGIMEVERSGFLADGTDMEQSLNYNKGLVKTVDKFLHMASRLPENEKGDWLDNLKRMYKYRYYYMHAIAKPDGSQPIIGKNNTWRSYGKAQKSMPGLTSDGLIKDFTSLPLSKTINDYIYLKDDVVPPAFDSIYFPYGGYAVLRDDWSADSLYCFMKTSRPGNGHMREGGNGLEISAYGQNLIVNSGGEPYNPDFKHKGFWHSTVAHNSISVDGYSQNLRLNADIPVVYEKPIDTRFMAGKSFDFAEGKFTGAYSGWNFKKHGTASPQIHKIPHDVVVDDVTHDRQVIFLKNEKIWVVTDIVDSKSEHTFSQSWLLGPEYKPEIVKLGRNVVSTDMADAVNFSLYHFGIEKLGYDKFYGVFEDDCVMGWGGKEIESGTGNFMPAVSLLAEWKGSGKQILVTVIVPYEKNNPVVKRKSDGRGFEMTLANGGNVSYNYYGEGDVEAELKTKEAKFVLTTEGGYEITASGDKIPVVTPNIFKWKKTGFGEVPSYN